VSPPVFRYEVTLVWDLSAKEANDFKENLKRKLAFRRSAEEAGEVRVPFPQHIDLSNVADTTIARWGWQPLPCLPQQADRPVCAAFCAPGPGVGDGVRRGGVGGGLPDGEGIGGKVGVGGDGVFLLSMVNDGCSRECFASGLHFITTELTILLEMTSQKRPSET